ncbi:MAG: photosystem P840 reaction-center cytochrome c-551 [Acidobacteriota bacterium]
MIQTTLSAILGLLFVAVGAFNVWIIFHSSSRLKDRGASARLVRGHRIGGYIFIMLFCVMTYFMIVRVQDTSGELSLRPMIHMILAMLMVPLLFVKVLIARYYKTYYSALMPIGLGVFTLAFVLVMMTAGPYLLRKATLQKIPLDSIEMGINTIDIEAAQQLTKNRCSTCHNLDRVVSARKDAPGWLATVERMRTLPGSNINENDAKTIITYLVAQVAVKPAEPNATEKVGKAKVDARCNRCHELDRIYKATKTAEEWRDTVARMVGYAPDNFISTEDADEINKFLATTQTAEAVKQRAEQVASAAKAPAVDQSANKEAAKQLAAATPNQPGTLPTIAVVAVVGGLFGALMLRRPLPAAARAEAAAIAPSAPSKGPQPLIPEAKKAALILQLARIESQTHDAKTLRFLVPEGQRFFARPGQFLTFNWMVDGKKVVRSYSICSSPTQTGYVEITPKRVESGYVSRFLNERAMVGLTVEAKGPSGQFFFDETKHKKIALIAAGSGITPMMSILRYIDDRCLSTDVTLIYSVRTNKDIIFEKDFAHLKTRLDNFRYLVSLSKPTGEWKGPSGRLNRALIESNVKNIADTTFFLCGPKGFMDSVHEILTSLGVKNDQIKQEIFGGPAAAPEPVVTTEASVQGQVEFARSRKSCDIPQGRSLLEVAEMNGVAIPFSCRQGQCGTCTTRLLAGEVTMDAEDGLDPDLKAEGYVLTCVGHGKGKVKLDA